jgi:hypothetical protein
MRLVVWPPSDRLGGVQRKTRTTNHMKKNTTGVLADASAKTPFPTVCMANCHSRGGRQLERAVFAPYQGAVDAQEG